MFQQMGFGLAVAIFIDATIVRTIIVPAAMELLGDWNWYLPRWLEWLPDLSVEGHVPETRTGDEAPVTGVPAGDPRAAERALPGTATVAPTHAATGHPAPADRSGWRPAAGAAGGAGRK